MPSSGSPQSFRSCPTSDSDDEMSGLPRTRWASDGRDAVMTPPPAQPDPSPSPSPAPCQAMTPPLAQPDPSPSPSPAHRQAADGRATKAFIPDEFVIKSWDTIGTFWQDKEKEDIDMQTSLQQNPAGPPSENRESGVEMARVEEQFSGTTAAPLTEGTGQPSISPPSSHEVSVRSNPYHHDHQGNTIMAYFNVTGGFGFGNTPIEPSPWTTVKVESPMCVQTLLYSYFNKKTAKSKIQHRITNYFTKKNHPVGFAHPGFHLSKKKGIRGRKSG